MDVVNQLWSLSPSNVRDQSKTLYLRALRREVRNQRASRHGEVDGRLQQELLQSYALFLMPFLILSNSFHFLESFPIQDGITVSFTGPLPAS